MLLRCAQRQGGGLETVRRGFRCFVFTQLGCHVPMAHARKHVVRSEVGLSNIFAFLQDKLST